MVQRKTSFDNLKKAVRRQKTNRKPKNVSFDEMVPIVADGKLLVEKGDTVYFMRPTEFGLVFCVGVIHTIYVGGRNDGGVDVWDETKENFWTFNWKTSLDKVDVRRIPEEPSSEPSELVTVETVGCCEKPEEIPREETPANPVAADLGLEDGQDDEGNELVIDCD